MTRASYLSQWRAAHPGKGAEYNRAYRARLKHGRAQDVARMAEGAARRRRSTYERHRDAYLIEMRMRQRGRAVTIAEARELLAEYGPDYPLARGLSAAQRKWLRRSKSRYVQIPHAELVFEAYEKSA